MTLVNASTGSDTSSEGIDSDGQESRISHEPIRPDGIGMIMLNIFRGFCMGAADTVPGVSGGTVALILGHYDRLIAAISHVDTEALGLLRSGKWTELIRRLDLRFLITLGIGIVVGIGSLAGLMHWLLQHRVNETMAVFFGLVLASVWVVRRNVTQWTIPRWILLGMGVLVALGISRIPATTGDASHGFLFFSASIAICAMILPGISGAFILLLLGVYEPVIGMIKGVVKGQIDLDILGRLAVFAAGCLFGLLAFSRLLNYLLKHFRDATMAALIGLMIGSVGRLWPLQRVTAETAELELKYQEFEWVSPVEYDGSVLMLVVLAIVAAVVVVAADRFTLRMQSSASGA
ncbi:MAG TPA: DUF368 domain-containing protein [Rhodopirellula baltica]|uniref:Integral membrane protein n=1 Tax=Rhodopirellula baltica (strain DSM 10527 / NCIMB 13988 / SH1) TaxID=243090 RepID=Q7UNR0_RHOBA|nr:DUF368 domain-containing protein [Rhodopirellula baltica]CAD75358.1 conserved hypothetical protein [Rhodopirellula baltica SH 1]HBE65624.1 DUF368 domain-containing protein [Rhodopirellula baltica]